MSDQLSIIEFSEDMGAQFQAFFDNATGLAQEALQMAYENITSGGDVETALTSVNEHIVALQQMGATVAPIINGLIAAIEAASEQRDALVYTQEMIRDRLDEVAPGLHEIAADHSSPVSVRDYLTDFAYDEADSVSIIAEHENSLHENTQELITNLRDEGFMEQAHTLTVQAEQTEAARKKLADLIEAYAKLIDERARSEASEVEPMAPYDLADEVA